MIKIIGLIFLFLCVFKVSPAQQVYFNKHFSMYPTGMYAFNVFNDDSGYILVGTGGDSIYTYQNVVILAKIDLLGTLTEYSTIYRQDTFLFCGVGGGADIFQKDILIAGSQKVQGESNPILFRVDSNLNLVWSNLYTDTNIYPYSSSSMVRRISDNSGYVICGEHGVSSSTSYFQLIKTDTLGNILWRRFYGNIFRRSRSESIIELPDGGFLLGGDTYSTSVQDTRNGMVVKTDSLGNEIWRKQVGGLYNDGYARVALAKDSNYIIALSYTEWVNQGKSVGRLNFIKTDTSGAVLWNKRYGIPKEFFTCNNFKALDNGGFIAIGNSGNTDTGTTLMPGWIMKISNDGDSVWFRELKKYHNWGYEHNPYDIIQTSDKGYIACGLIRDVYQGQFVDMWIVKLDSLGCDTPGCQYIGVNELEIRNEKLEIFPNPFGEEMYVTLPEEFGGGMLVMYDVQGRRAVEAEIPESYGQQSFTVQTGQLKPGVYMVELAGKDGRVWMRKVVKKG